MILLRAVIETRSGSKPHRDLLQVVRLHRGNYSAEDHLKRRTRRDWKMNSQMWSARILVAAAHSTGVPRSISALSWTSRKLKELMTSRLMRHSVSGQAFQRTSEEAKRPVLPLIQPKWLQTIARRICFQLQWRSKLNLKKVLLAMLRAKAYKSIRIDRETFRRLHGTKSVSSSNARKIGWTSNLEEMKCE